MSTRCAALSFLKDQACIEPKSCFLTLPLVPDFRGYSREPRLVSALGAPFLRGLRTQDTTMGQAWICKDGVARCRSILLAVLIGRGPFLGAMDWEDDGGWWEHGLLACDTSTPAGYHTRIGWVRCASDHGSFGLCEIVLTLSAGCDVFVVFWVL